MMRLLFALSVSFCLLTSVTWAQDEQYKTGPDAERKEGVPQGTVTKGVWDQSEIYPGTVRDYWVYVPQQYQKGQPACLMVFQDGAGFVNEKGHTRVPVVFDNLIHAGEMPVTIGVFIQPGVVPPTKPGQNPRKNRSFEYDTLSDQYVRFLLEEILADVGQKYDISSDPKHRAICGNSSGGICAFTAAWERPDSFGKVVSHIGSFTNIRGGHVYPAVIRKTEIKPIKVFLQDGSNDLDNLHGNWPLANQQMAAALKFVGYDHKFVYGEGRHSARHGGAIFPDTMRWLWSDVVSSN
ncbi:alpha/beta hydrolase-fold protein [Bremerella sp. JC770]|uniref:alpha/beta hydrolase n=1 Tax=Bremerella sp. JC770 TaxID=3232137 RepID=UPI003457B35A